MRALLFFFLMLPLTTMGQTDVDMDDIARNVPGVHTRSVGRLAQYFSEQIPDDRGRIRAIFTWITLNVRYLDTNNSSELWATPEHLERQRPENVLRNKTAVCQGFANLFQALAKAAGMECQVVTGIVKNEEGEVMRVGHAWVAAFVQSEWRLFDPTWSMPNPGERWRTNDRYFMPTPESFVLNHLPDDPAWQLLDNPVSEKDFRENNSADLIRLIRTPTFVEFNHRDTLRQWLEQDSITRIFAAEARILQFNGSNQRVLFGLGQGYWGLFFDLREQLDSIADASILQETIPIDTSSFVAQLTLMERYHQRARAFFDQVTEPQRAAQTEKFFNPIDVACMLAKLKGAMYSALFEHTWHLAKKSTDETGLNSLIAISDHADRAYREARRNINCAKLGSTCFEMWHNQSLVHLQLAEKHAAFALQAGSGNMSPQNRASAENALKKAQILYALAGVETDKLAAIPPRFAFVLDRKRSVEQGFLHLKSIQLLLRRQQFSSAVDQVLNTPGNENTLAWLTDSLQNIHNDLSELLLQVEDSYGNLGTEYCDFALFNLHQEAYTLRFNLANLFFKTALEAYQSARQNGRLESQKKQIALQLQTAGYWLQEARISLEFLQRSKKASPSSLEQRQVQINKLTRSITEFTAAL